MSSCCICPKTPKRSFPIFLTTKKMNEFACFRLSCLSSFPQWCQLRPVHLIWRWYTTTLMPSIPTRFPNSTNSFTPMVRCFAPNKWWLLSRDCFPYYEGLHPPLRNRQSCEGDMLDFAESACCGIDKGFKTDEGKKKSSAGLRDAAQAGLSFFVHLWILKDTSQGSVVDNVLYLSVLHRSDNPNPYFDCSRGILKTISKCGFACRIVESKLSVLVSIFVG